MREEFVPNPQDRRGCALILHLKCWTHQFNTAGKQTNKQPTGSSSFDKYTQEKICLGFFQAFLSYIKTGTSHFLIANTAIANVTNLNPSTPVHVFVSIFRFLPKVYL